MRLTSPPFFKKTPQTKEVPPKVKNSEYLY
jgi:hypothetical protein